MKKLWSIVVAMVLLMSSFSVATAQTKTKVMTTFYPVYYLAQRIAGDKAEVSMLLDGNQDAHEYEAGARDAAKIQQANVFIYQNEEMEHFVEDILKLIDQDKTKVVKATADVTLLMNMDEEEAQEENHHHHELDPHTWMDPMTYAKQAETIKNALIEQDPDNREVYTQNTAKLLEELTALDAEYKEATSKLTDKTFVVQHAAFGYLAQAYGLTQVAITGISSTNEPSAAALAKMQQFVTENQTKVIFVEPTLDDAIAQTVATATNAALRPLRTLEALSAEEIAQGQDYFSVMRDNLKQLVSE